MIVCLISSCKYFIHIYDDKKTNNKLKGVFWDVDRPEFRTGISTPATKWGYFVKWQIFCLATGHTRTSLNGVTMFNWCAGETLHTKSIGIITFWPDVAVYLCIPHSYMDALGLPGMTTFLYTSQPFVINVIKSFIYKTIINIVVLKMLVLKELGVWCVVPFFICLR